MNLTDLGGQVGEWLRGEGAESDIVVSTRVRLARNLAGLPFVGQASEDQRRDMARLLRAKIESAGIADDLMFLDLAELPQIDREFLVERHLISREHADGEGARGVAIGKGERISIMTNEEDHLRIQGIKSGFEMDQTWEMVNAVDDLLEAQMEYAFSPRFGYLTACPTNVGTGLRVSVMLHLPALAITQHIEKLFNAVAKMGLVVRGLFGEGTQAYGDLFQISNQVTLGRSEGDIMGSVASVIPRVVGYERQARQYLLQSRRAELEDRVWRSYGMLRYARTITSEETMHLLSQVRMGVNLELVNDVEMDTINRLFVSILPAHLQKRVGRELEEAERNLLRARIVRDSLARA